MSTYTINVSFQTRVNKTTRTLEIAESFGLGLDEKDWTLYDNLELEVEQGDVVYITGQSGSGKSVVLRELQRQMKDEGLSVASIDDFTFDNDVNVIDQLGKTTSEALGLLSMAGLNDAYLFVRKPSEMSDGQKSGSRSPSLLSRAQRYGLRMNLAQFLIVLPPRLWRRTSSVPRER